MAVVADLEEGVEDMLVGGGGQVRPIVARPDRPCQREPSGGGRADEQRAARDQRCPPRLPAHRVANARHPAADRRGAGGWQRLSGECAPSPSGERIWRLGSLPPRRSCRGALSLLLLPTPPSPLHEPT